MVFEPEDRTADYFPGDLFSTGASFSITASRTAALAERGTTYSVTTNFSTADGVDYSTLPPGMGTTTKSGAWNVAFQFTHNLQERAEQAEANWFFLRWPLRTVVQIT